MANRPDDPESRRVEELLARVGAGSVSEAETEELQLYARGRPELLEQIRQRENAARLGEGWLARIEADHAIQRVETSRRTKVERAVGLGLLLAGYPLAMMLPAIGVVALGGGILALGYSFVRVRLQTHKQDPYKDVVR